MNKKIFNYKLFILLFFISILSSIVSFYPLYMSNKQAVFFSFEPDAPYVANAFRYIYTNKILYDAHPATPSIVSIAYAFIPIRIYSRFFEHVPFFMWSINNIYSLFYYSRIFQNIIFAFSIFILLAAVYNLTKNYLSILFMWLGLFVFTYFPYLGIIIQSETLSLLIISIWFYVFSIFLKRKKYNLYLLLCAISGIALANKLTNMFYIFASVFQILSFINLSYKTTIKRFINGLCIVVISFLIGTWPIRDRYIGLFGWIQVLFTHSGIHGSGDYSLFNLSQYILSLSTLVHNEKYATVIVITTLFLFIFYKIKKLHFINTSMTVLLISMSLGVLIFAKFPLVHYQIPLYIGILFICTYMSFYFYKPILVALVGIFAVISLNNIVNYWKLLDKEIDGSLIIENFLVQHPPKIATVWEWGKTSDYALIHIRDWSGEPFASFLHKERPTLYSLTTDMSQVVVDYEKRDAVFSVCWDQLFIQKTELNRFLQKYNDHKFNVEPILGSTRDMYLVVSDHCKKNE